MYIHTHTFCYLIILHERKNKKKNRSNHKPQLCIHIMYILDNTIFRIFHGSFKKMKSSKE